MAVKMASSGLSCMIIISMLARLDVGKLAGLATAFLPTMLAHAARARLLQPITGGRLAAVLAVLG